MNGTQNKCGKSKNNRETTRGATNETRVWDAGAGHKVCLPGITEDGRCEEDVKCKIGPACAAFGGLG